MSGGAVTPPVGRRKTKGASLRRSDTSDVHILAKSPMAKSPMQRRSQSICSASMSNKSPAMSLRRKNSRSNMRGSKLPTLGGIGEDNEVEDVMKCPSKKRFSKHTMTMRKTKSMTNVPSASSDLLEQEGEPDMDWSSAECLKAGGGSNSSMGSTASTSSSESSSSGSLGKKRKDKPDMDWSAHKAKIRQEEKAANKKTNSNNSKLGEAPIHKAIGRMVRRHSLRDLNELSTGKDKKDSGLPALSPLMQSMAFDQFEDSFSGELALGMVVGHGKDKSKAAPKTKTKEGTMPGILGLLAHDARQASKENVVMNDDIDEDLEDDDDASGSESSDSESDSESDSDSDDSEEEFAGNKENKKTRQKREQKKGKGRRPKSSTDGRATRTSRANRHKKELHNGSDHSGNNAQLKRSHTTGHSACTRSPKRSSDPSLKRKDSGRRLRNTGLTKRSSRSKMSAAPSADDLGYGDDNQQHHGNRTPTKGRKKRSTSMGGGLMQLVAAVEGEDPTMNLSSGSRARTGKHHGKHHGRPRSKRNLVAAEDQELNDDSDKIMNQSERGTQASRRPTRDTATAALMDRSESTRSLRGRRSLAIDAGGPAAALDRSESTRSLRGRRGSIATDARQMRSHSVRSLKVNDQDESSRGRGRDAVQDDDDQSRTRSASRSGRYGYVKDDRLCLTAQAAPKKSVSGLAALLYCKPMDLGGDNKDEDNEDDEEEQEEKKEADGAANSPVSVACVDETNTEPEVKEEKLDKAKAKKDYWKAKLAGKADEPKTLTKKNSVKKMSSKSEDILAKAEQMKQQAKRMSDLSDQSARRMRQVNAMDHQSRRASVAHF